MNAVKIMIICQAEKPYQASDGNQINGVTNQGEKDNEGLTIRGWQRAGALAAYFTPLPDGTFMGSGVAEPAALFASGTDYQNREKMQHNAGGKSSRSRETLTPLSDKLDLVIHDDFETEEQLATAVIGSKDVALICGEPQRIPSIAHHIPTLRPTPSEWPKDKNGENRFDVVWIFDWKPNHNKYHFYTAYQCLLSGDLPGEAVSVSELLNTL
ncbi:hypothetical protein [Spirosoma sp.]|uniref:hypothetical protein n=1 Tax=Spirosoma sp. TaxID=1899569 RepID=UPI003B3B5794